MAPLVLYYHSIILQYDTAKVSAMEFTFSSLSEALASHSYNRVADICDNLRLEAAYKGFQGEWPYTVHLLGHMFADDVNSARFLWKSIPSAVKENNPELVAAWKIGQNLWTTNYAAVHEAIRGFSWSSDVQGFVIALSEVYKKRRSDLMVSAYSTISVPDAALFLGMDEDAATEYAEKSQDWIVDKDAQMLTVKKREIAVKQKLDSSKLQRLTEYVHHLEH